MNSNDLLLDYFQNELSYLRNMGEGFAERFPKVANRLELSGRKCPDPHIEFLLQSFAFLTGRIQYNLESEAPQIPTSLLSILYPHLESPIPSMAIARFEVDPGKAKGKGFAMERNSPLYATARQGEVCKFRTCYETKLWPLKVDWEGFDPVEDFEFITSKVEVASVLRIRIKAEGKNPLNKLGLDSLRFYLSGENQTVHGLYELLTNNVVKVALVPADPGTPAGERQPVWLPPKSISPVGFAEDEAVLPEKKYSHSAYRLLQEYFVLPEKFLFLDIAGLEGILAEKEFDILVLLDKVPGNKIKMKAGTFLLGCTPIINLFPKTTDPIQLDHTKYEYKLLADKYLSRSAEIHSIEKVSSRSAEGKTRVISSFFAYGRWEQESSQTLFWSSRRVISEDPRLPGTEIYLSFHDNQFNPVTEPGDTVYAQTLCTNRDLADQLPAGAEFKMDGAGPVKHKSISILHKPTQSRTPRLRGQALWQLVSHLSLNHLSLGNEEASLNSFQEILRLYAHSNFPSVHQQISGIIKMSCAKKVGRMGPDAWRGFCQGTVIDLVFDEKAYEGGSAYLMASVLNHFFDLYASINSFTQLNFHSKQRGKLKEWKPMVGAQELL